VAVDHKLAAILSADVVGYSRLMAEDETDTIRTLTDYREAVTMRVRRHRGRVVDTPGDNVLAEFPTALDAVRCAVEIQAVIRVLAYAGQRRGEVCRLEWSEIRDGVWHLSAAKSKNNYDSFTPLSTAVRAFIESRPRKDRWVFPSPTDPSRHIAPPTVSNAVKNKQSFFGLPAWSVHDVRRSVTTGMKTLGISQETLDRVLNHVPPKLQRTYNVHDYLAEQRQALDLWAEALSSPTVVALPAAGR